MEELIFKIGTKKNPLLITLKEYKGRKLVDIRKFYQDKNEKEEKLMPTRKGISLNPFQLEQFIEVLNSKSENISNFFQKADNSAKEIKVEVTNSSFGRGFNLEYKNGETFLKINEDFKHNIGENNVDFFKKLLFCFSQSVNDIIEDQDDIDLLLDILNKNINKIKW
tara:strand:- start:25 stop:522 length:498 start_codon:yes stop_codon:yes gene_type:complete